MIEKESWPTTDPRIQKTQKSLTLAVYNLFPKHSWQDITISMICSEANVSRSTFYTHFDDKDALLRRMFQIFETDIMETSVSGRSIDLNRKFRFVPVILEDMKKRKIVVARQQKDINSFQLMQHYLKLLKNILTAELSQSSYSELLEQKDIALVSLALGAEVKKWVDKDCRKPVKDILEKFDNFAESYLFQ